MLTKENTYLIELHGDPQTQVCNLKSGETLAFAGYRIHTIYNTDSEELARYDNLTDTIDISPICKKEVDLVWVSSIDGGKTLSWLKSKVEAFSDDHKEIIIKENKVCDPEEVKFLNETFPEWFEYSSCDPAEFTKKAAKSRDEGEQNND